MILPGIHLVDFSSTKLGLPLQLDACLLNSLVTLIDRLQDASQAAGAVRLQVVPR